MAVTALPYGVFLTDLGSAVHSFTADTDKVALLTNAYTPNYTTHVSFADVVASEVAGSGYTAGGNTLTGKSLTYDGPSKTATLNAAATTWTNLAVVTRYAVFYRSTGTNSTSKLIGLLDFGADRTYATEPFQLSFPTGVVSFTAV